MKFAFLLFFIILMAVLFFGRPITSSASQAPAAQATSSGSPPTADIASPDIYYYINMAIEDMERSTKFNMLEHINGSSYQVVYAGFKQENGVPTIFQLKVRCECAENAPCCNPMHTFVVTMQAMDDAYYEPLILSGVPSSVMNLEVQCFDHTIFSGRMTVPWQKVVRFLQDDLDGFRLWAEVTPES